MLAKFWLLLVAAAAMIALGVAFAGVKPASRELSRLAARALDRAQQSAELMLRIEARDAVSTAARIAQDSALVQFLEQASLAGADARELRSRVEGRLQSLIERLKPELRPELMILVDQRGKQVGRRGPGAERMVAGRDGLIGFPLVEAVLRGLRRDDTWSLDGKLFLMAGTPVVSRARGRYVGALLLGDELDSGFAKRLQSRLDRAEVAFFLRGRVAGTSSESPDLVKLASLFTATANRVEMERRGRSAAHLLGQGEAATYAIMTPLPGQASAHDAFFAVFEPSPAALGLRASLGLVERGDLSWSSFPWLLLGGGFVLIAAAGLLLFGREASRPLRRLKHELDRLRTAEGQGPIDEQRARGLARSVYRAINEQLERAAKSAGGGRGSVRPAAPAREKMVELMPAVSLRPRPDSSLQARTRRDPIRPEAAINPAVDATLPAVAGGQPGEPGLGARPDGRLPVSGPLEEVEPSPEVARPFSGPPIAPIAAPPERPGGAPVVSLELEEGVTELDFGAEAFFAAELRPAQASAEGDGAQLAAGPPGGAAGHARLSPRQAGAADSFEMEPLPIPEARESAGPQPSARVRIPESERAEAERVESEWQESEWPEGEWPEAGWREPARPMPAVTMPARPAPAVTVAARPMPGKPGPDRAATPDEGRARPDKPPEPGFEPALESFDAMLPPLDLIGEHVTTETVMSSVPQSLARVMQAPAGTAAPVAEPVAKELDLRAIFSEFLMVKRQCGESVEHLTFDRFASKLEANREQIMARTSCRTVRFQVYIKDGKAAVKATPVTE